MSATETENTDTSPNSPNQHHTDNTGRGITTISLQNRVIPEALSWPMVFVVVYSLKGVIAYDDI